MTAADRFYGRLEPLAYADAENDFTLQNLCDALMAPVAITELARDSDTHIAWGKLRDPDECPEQLLDWLAVDQGVILPASAITAAEKRSRIEQAAGRYRGTQRAWKEEIQRALTGTKTVRLATFVDGDRWKVTIITDPAETPDPAAVDRTARAQKPNGVLLTYMTEADAIIDEGEQIIDNVPDAVIIDTVTVADIS